MSIFICSTIELVIYSRRSVFFTKCVCVWKRVCLKVWLMRLFIIYIKNATPTHTHTPTRMWKIRCAYCISKYWHWAVGFKNSYYNIEPRNITALQKFWIIKFKIAFSIHAFRYLIPSILIILSCELFKAK